MAGLSAFLEVSEELREAFASAQKVEEGKETGAVRYLRVEVGEGDSLQLTDTGLAQGTLQEDFDSLAARVAMGQPCTYLFRLAEEAHHKWLLLAWVPDDSPVRMKMLASSSRQDLRSALGVGYFAGEYYANVPEDMSYSAYQASKASVDTDVLLSASEVAKKEIDRLEREGGAAQGMSAAAMGVMPFPVSAELQEALERFKEMAGDGEGAAAALSMQMAADGGETFDLLQHQSGEAGTGEGGAPGGQGWAAAVCPGGQEAPLFALVRGGGKESRTVFIFLCPEGAPVRAKMSYSSAKASVLGTIREVGIDVDSTLEIREVDELSEAVEQSLDPKLSAGPSSSGAGGGGGSSGGPSSDGRLLSAAQESSSTASKPRRAARGRARLTKKPATVS